MRKWLFIIIGALFILVVVGLLAFPQQVRQIVGGRQNNQLAGLQTTAVTTGDLTAYVGATGAARSNQTAQVSWQTSGQVADVKVTKGQQVSKGDVLSSLEPTSLSTQIINAQGDLVTAQTNLQNVLDNSKARADAELALAQAQKALQDAQKNTQSKLFQNAGPNTIDVARANVITAQQAVDDATTIYNRVANRSQDDVQYANALSNLANARQKLLTAQYNLNFVLGLPNPLDVQTSYAQLDQAKANVLTAKQNWDKIKNGPDPNDVTTAQAKVQAAQATVNLSRLTAPFNGTITLINAKPGDMVAPGTFAFQIDDLSKLLVDLQVSEVDINRVQLGQPVDLSFDAIPNQTYTGTVTDIATVGTTASGTVNYTVTVEITNPDGAIKSGMTAAANIAVTQLKNVLLVPSRAVRVVNNQRVVYVVRNNTPVPVEVVLGASDNINTQVVSGDLHAGDLIVLNPASSPSTGGGGFRFFGGGGGGGGGNTNQVENTPASTPGTGGANPGGANPGSTPAGSQP